MAKKISVTDIFEEADIFLKIRKSAEDTIITLGKMKAELSESAKLVKEGVKNSSVTNTKGIQEFTNFTQKANQLQRESIEIQKQEAQAKKLITQATMEEVKLKKLADAEAQKQINASAKIAKALQNEASVYKQLEKNTRDYKNQSKELAATLLQMRDNGQQSTDTYAKLEQQFKETTAEAQKGDAELKRIDKTVGDNFRNVGNYEGAIKPLKLQLRELTQAMQNMSTSDPRFQEMANKAGELKDQIQDTANVIKSTAGSGLENLAGSMAKVGQIGVAAFQGLQSSMVLLGVENEEVLKSMQKLQALAGLGDALKTLGGLGDMLTEIKAGFVAAASKMGLFTATQSANTAATAVNTVATEVQGGAIVATTVATTAATRATKLLRMALITSGIGAIVVLLGVAAEAMGLFEDKTAEEEKAQKLLERQTKSLEKTLESYGKATDAIIQTVDNATRSELALARQRGASQKELTAITKAGAEDRLRILQTETDDLRSIYLQQSKTGTTESFEKAETAYLESVQKTKEAQITIQEIDGDIAESARENVQNFSKTAVEITDLHDQIVDEQIKLIKDDDQRAQTQLIVEAERRKRDVKNTVADKKQKATLIKAIEENLVLELDKLDNEWYIKSLQAQKEADAAKLKAKNEFSDKMEAITEANTRRTMTEQQIEEREVNDKYFELENLAKDDADALEEIEIAHMNELNDIRLKYDDIAYKNKQDIAAKKKELQDKQDAAELKTEKERQAEIKKMVQQTTEFFNKQSEKKIANLDKEISASEKQLETLKTLADNGNINAKQSMAEQQRIIDEGNRQKLAEQKRQARIKLAESVYSTYSAKVEAGSKNALSDTIKDTVLLQQFISSLPAFEKGTEDTGKNGLGVDGRGGFHAVLHPNERVIPKGLNEQIGNLTNEQLAKVAQEYQNGKSINGGLQIQSSLDFALLMNEVKDLKNVMKNKPETNIEIGEITGSLMEIVQSTKRGNNITYNRFKVRK